MTSEDDLRLAFCWYEPEEWEKLKRIAKDSGSLDDSYEEWKSNANDAISEIRGQGNIIQKISIKMDELVTWCQENSLENNSEARSNYAAKKLQERRSET